MSDPTSRLETIFRAVLDLEPSRALEGLSREELEAWDSLAHVQLVAAVESEFGTSIDVMEALELQSFRDFRDLLDRGAAGTEGVA